MLSARVLAPLFAGVLAASAALAAVVPAGGAALANEAIPLMAEAQATELGEEMRIDGTPTRIRAFRIERDLATVLAHYRGALGPRRIEAEVDGWRILSRRVGRVLQTVRLRAGGKGSTEGTLSEADLDAALAARARPPAFPLPAASRLVADLEMRDRGRHAHLLAWHNNHGPAANVQHLSAHLAARGYHLERELAVSDGGLRGRSLWFSGSGGEALAVLVEDHGVVTVTLKLMSNRAGAGT